MIGRLILVFHIAMWILTICVCLGGVVALEAAASEGLDRQFRAVVMVIVAVAFYWLSWLGYWLITGNGLSAIA